MSRFSTCLINELSSDWKILNLFKFDTNMNLTRPNLSNFSYIQKNISINKNSDHIIQFY